jgi:glutathione synthase/RimK-type ligase-like ATP-grasp enzyme
MILIISSIHDYHSRVVQWHLEKRGHSVFIADLLELGRGAEISYRPECPEQTEWRRADGQCIRLGDVKAVWFRRSFAASVPRQVTDADERHFILREWAELLRGVLVTIDAPFVNDPIATLYATKPLQLALALRVGLNVPATLITNSARRALEFVGSHPAGAVHKTLKPYAPRMLPTKAWEEGDSAHLHELELAPTIFQTLVAGERELRITIIGERVFAAEHEPSCLDGRADLSATYRPHDLPAPIRHALLQLMKRLGLIFGTIDMKLDSCGNYHFLEVNAQGQFLWIEIETGLPLSATLADLLCDLASGASGYTTMGRSAGMQASAASTA